MDHDDLASHLYLQYGHEGGVLDAACIVGLERLYSPARIFGLDGEQLPLDLVQLGIVSCIHFCIGAINVESIAVERGISSGANPCLEGCNVLLCVLSCPHSVQQVCVNPVFTLAMVLLQIDHCEESPQVPQPERHGVLLVGGFVKDVPCLGRLKLVQVAEEKDRDASKQCVQATSYFSQSEVDIVEHVGRNHADFVDYEATQVSEQDFLLVPLLLWHGEVSRAKFEAKCGVEGLAVDVRRGCTSEGGQQDIGAVRVIASLLQCRSHHGIDGGNKVRLARPCTPMNYYQGWSGHGEVLALGEDGVGHDSSGIVEG